MSSKLPVALVAAAAAARRARRGERPGPPAVRHAGPVGTAYATGFNCRTLDLDGVQRRFEVYVPANVPADAPVVFMFHGSSGTGEQFANISGWREEADQRGLIAVFPTGETHDRVATPLMMTVQAPPHCPKPQPNFGPSRPESLRRT